MMMSTLEPLVAFVTTLLKTTAQVSRVGQLPELVSMVPFTVLLVGHCLAVAGFTKNAYSGRLLSYVLVWLKRSFLSLHVDSCCNNGDCMEHDIIMMVN